MNSPHITAVVEHPVFFNMEGLSDNPELETRILQGLNDLAHSNHSDLYFLFSGAFCYLNPLCHNACGNILRFSARTAAAVSLTVFANLKQGVIESKGVPFTHALISRFPSIQALRTYYEKAIRDIAMQMIPWLKNEFCVDYVVEMEKGAIILDVTRQSAAHVTFIKLSSDVTDSNIKGAMDAFLALAQESDNALQLTCGENVYIRESYRTMSHAFLAYFASVEAMQKWQQDASVVSVLQNKILPMADSFAMVSLVPYAHPSF